MQEPIEPDTGITEATRQRMFAFIDDLVRPNHVAKPVNTHLFHLIGELEALRQDLKRMEDPRAKFLELAIIELDALQ
jgi:hypothetical protein